MTDCTCHRRYFIENGCVHPGVPAERTRQPAGGPACLFVLMRADQLRLSVAIFVSSDDEMAAVNTILSVGQKFSTFEEFETALKDYQQQTKQIFTVSHSKGADCVRRK